MGGWKALRQVYGQTRGPRGGVHKTAQVLDKLPQALPPQAQQRWQAIWRAPDRPRAEMAWALCSAPYEAKYPKAAEGLAPEREVLWALYACPAAPWGHIRTTTPRESTLAPVRARPAKPRGGLSRVTLFAMGCN